MNDEEREKALKRRMDDLWAQIKEHIDLLAEYAPDVQSGDEDREDVADFWTDLVREWGEIKQDEAWLTATSRFVEIRNVQAKDIRVRRESIFSWFEDEYGVTFMLSDGHKVRTSLSLAEADELMGFRKSPKVVNTPEPPASEEP